MMFGGGLEMWVRGSRGLGVLLGYSGTVRRPAPTWSELVRRDARYETREGPRLRLRTMYGQSLWTVTRRDTVPRVGFASLR